MVSTAGDEAASNLTLNPRAVHQSIVAKMMEKHRNQSVHSLLPTWLSSKEKVEVPTEFKVTLDLDCLPFCILLLITLLPEDLDMFLAFHHHLGLPPSYLVRSFEISSSTKFAQCWIIMNKVEKSAIPVAFFLLPSKKQICHRVMFEAFHEASMDMHPEY